MKNISASNIYGYIFAFVFAAFIPIQEWPDSNTHWMGEWNSFFFKNLTIFFDLSPPSFQINPNFTFFSNSYAFISEQNDRLINIFKLPIAILFLYLLNKFSIAIMRKPFTVCPPYIFSLLAISVEPFSIMLVTISYMVIFSGRLFGGLGIAFLATIIDRSMAPTFFGLIMLVAYLSINKVFWRYTIEFIVLFTLLAFSLDDLKDNLLISLSSIIDFYGLTSEDILYNQKYGDNNYLALLISMSGLYGWMSLRPEPWILYYLMTGIFFLIGFFSGGQAKRVEFMLFLAPVILTLNIFPPLSQARYYPLLTLLFWGNIFIGVRLLFPRVNYFLFLILIMTVLGLLISGG